MNFSLKKRVCFLMAAVITTVGSTSMASYDVIGKNLRLVVESRGADTQREVKFQLCGVTETQTLNCSPVGGDQWHSVTSLEQKRKSQAWEFVGSAAADAVLTGAMVFALASFGGVAVGIFAESVLGTTEGATAGAMLIGGLAGGAAGLGGSYGLSAAIRPLNATAQWRDIGALNKKILTDEDYSASDKTIRRIAESLDIILLN